MKELTIQIDGMTCNGCANSVREALATLPVIDIAVSLTNQNATLQYDETQTTVEALVEVIENIGFDARA